MTDSTPAPDSTGPATDPQTGSATAPPARPALVIGYGAMGSVVAEVLVANGLDVRVWGRCPQRVEQIRRTHENTRYLPGHRLPEAIQWTADRSRAAAVLADQPPALIVSAIPVQYIREVWRSLLGLLGNSPITARAVVNVAKGLERDTLLTPTGIIVDTIEQAGLGPSPPCLTLTGPTIAHELAEGKPAAVVLAGEDPGQRDRLAAAFITPTLRVYTHADTPGAELAGAAKNVIAIAAGILDGLELGDNAKSAMLARGLAEITRLGVAIGARADTFFGIAGVGDLATTCFSRSGRNRSLGEQIARGRTLKEAIDHAAGVVEGVDTAWAILELARRNHVEMPITEMVARVLFEGLDPRAGVASLLQRERKEERVDPTG